MSYPVFGKVKTIVLPSPSAQVTYKEYKELYGIDLADIFDLELVGGTIGRITFKESVRNCIFLIAGLSTMGSPLPLCQLNAFVVKSTYDSDTNPMIVSLGSEYSVDESDYYGISLEILPTDPFDFEHMLISTIEY